MKNKKPEYILKMGFVAIGVLMVIFIIIGSWVWNLVFSPNNFDPNKWATRAIFNNALALVMMVLGFIAIDETLKAREEGKYNKRREHFNSLVKTLVEVGRIVFFDQFISWYAEKQVREKKIKHLTKHGMSRMEAEIIVDYAIETDIPIISGLKEGEKPTGKVGEDIVRKLKDGTEILIPAIRDTLAFYVEEVLNGSVTVEAETAAYYTTADRNKSANLESLEIAPATDRERVKAMRRSFIAKGISGLVYITLASLLVTEINEGVGTSEALWNFIFRIGSATFGFISGGFAGSTNVNFMYKWLGDKIRVINEYNKYYDLKEFVPKSYQETYQERIKEAHKKEEEEAAKVIVPEVIDPSSGEDNNLLIENNHKEEIEYGSTDK